MYKLEENEEHNIKIFHLISYKYLEILLNLIKINYKVKNLKSNFSSLSARLDFIKICILKIR